MLFSRGKTADEELQRVEALERENERLHRAVSELSLLNDLAAEIGGLHDLDQMMQTILRRALNAATAEQGVITIIREGEGKQTLQTLVRTATDSAASSALRPSESLIGWMHLHHAPLRVASPKDDPRFPGTDWPPGVSSALCVPLIVRGRLTGIIILYNKKSAPGFSEDDQRLLSIIASQSAQVIENARLFEEEKMLLRMQEELRLAYEIQTSLLPAAQPSLPGYDITGVSIPAQEVGGDYFDFVRLDDDRLVLSVADVVGKGLPASLLMANAQATLRGQTEPGVPPGACLGRANDLLSRSIKPGKFITLFFAVIDRSLHTLTYANAGHNRPMLRRASGETSYLSEAGIVLGVRPGWTYDDVTVAIDRGDVLLIYSDGLTEAMDCDREQYGEARMQSILDAAAGEHSANIIDALLEDVRRHCAGEPQSDDITIIALKRSSESDS